MTTDRSVARIPLNTFAIAFGLAGLATVSTAATSALDLPTGPASAVWLLTGLVWIGLIVAHTLRGHRSAAPLASQLRHPVQGPIAALVPVVGMLLAAALAPLLPDLARALVIVFTTITGLFAGWIISTWFRGGLAIDSIHGGYFLPTVAGGYIAAIAAAKVGLDAVAIGAFAIGTFFWVAMFALVAARLMLRPALPDLLVPTIAIFAAPPAVAGAAWDLIAGTAVNGVAIGLAAMTVLMVLLQVALIPTYRRLPFSIGWWSFTFPFAAVAADGISWAARLHPAGWPIAVIALTGASTVLIALLAVKTVRLWSREYFALTTAAPKQIENQQKESSCLSSESPSSMEYSPSRKSTPWPPT